MDDVDDISLSELARILDSIEIVRHDCLLIFVKLRRAIDGQEDSGYGWDEDPVQNDHNGSAKLALIASIDRKAHGGPSTSGTRPAAAHARWRSSWRSSVPRSRDASHEPVRFCVPDSMDS